MSTSAKKRKSMLTAICLRQQSLKRLVGGKVGAKLTTKKRVSPQIQLIVNKSTLNSRLCTHTYMYAGAHKHTQGRITPYIARVKLLQRRQGEN